MFEIAFMPSLHAISIGTFGMHKGLRRSTILIRNACVYLSGSFITEALCAVEDDVHFHGQVARYGNHILMTTSITHFRKKNLFEI